MRKVLAVLALTTIALTGCSTAPMARISQNFQPAHSADFTTATHKALTAPVAQPVAINPVDQGGYASAGKDAPVGPAPEGITTSPINLGDLDTTAPCAYKRCGDPATTKAHVDGACQQSINDLQLQLDAANSGERITGHSGTGSQCTISTTK